MSLVELWQPPGKNCGLCGSLSCQEFLRSVLRDAKDYSECPFYQREKNLKEGAAILDAVYSDNDILSNPYDFVLEPLPGEISARKIVLPFRADLVEKLKIEKGDYVMGRPMGAGCPIPHVLKVIEADLITGLLYTWVVGPQIAREQKVKDVQAYHMIGFEGVAQRIVKEPFFGKRATFLPGFCMMNLNHTGLVNMILEKSHGLQVRIEDIRILANSKNGK
ncbi:MAG: Fe-S cluster protein [Firmicutes bacterium]|nr:Fe-S cluster protein [Bacillota bacterium]